MTASGEPEVALAFTAERWVEGFHRYCADHGGARIRLVVVDPAVALDEHFDVMVAGHRWPPLDASFVDALHERGVIVVGVHDRAEPASEQFLVSVGIDGAVASDLGPEAIVAEVARAVVVGAASGPGSRVGQAPERPNPSTRSRGGRGRVVAVGGPSGSGRTEVAIAVADGLANLRHTCVLIDADDVTPGVAARLGLPLEPNLATAVDRLTTSGRDPDVVFAGTSRLAGGLAVLPGLVANAPWLRPRPGQVVEVVDLASLRHDWVVVDVSGPVEPAPDDRGGRFDVARAILGRADAVVVVGTPDPAGCVRLVRWIADASTAARDVPLRIAVNRVARDRARAQQVVAELGRRGITTACSTVRDDPRVHSAAWMGTPVRRGRFRRDIDALVDDLVFDLGAEPQTLVG